MPLRKPHLYASLWQSCGQLRGGMDASRYKDYVLTSLHRVDDGGFVFVDASEDLEGVGKSVKIEGLRGQQAASGLHDIAVRFDKSALADGLKAYLQFRPAFPQCLQRVAAGTQVYATNRTHIVDAEMPLPEPQAVATVHSNMDVEITARERRLAESRTIKQGMMQQPFTGSIRHPIVNANLKDNDAHDS